MSMKSYLVPILYVYLFQSLFVPLLHLLEEKEAGGDDRCCSTVQFNTACTGGNGPCENPEHHHHHGHSHDDANCFACKIFSQTAICSNDKTLFLSKYCFFFSCNKLQYVSSLKYFFYLTRAPPTLLV